jgi:hypothetical protein
MLHTKVRSRADLVAAVHGGARDVRVVGTIEGLESVALQPGTHLAGGRLVFAGAGLLLSADNTISDTVITCPPSEIAIANAGAYTDIGTISLSGVRAHGQVLLTASPSTRFGSFEIDGLTIEEADLRARSERPRGFGVAAMQGALTIWNRNPDPESVLWAEVRDVSVGSDSSPIRGTGVFVGGYADQDAGAVGGRVMSPGVRTGPIVIDGGIAPGTRDVISGGVFIQAGADVAAVVNRGPVTTLGANDMALDNWGEVKHWVVKARVATRGASGIGFVNFGALTMLDVRAPIETFGPGARGFNLYDGSLTDATFHSIVTHADGAVGIQIAKPLPNLVVRHGVTTHGGTGTSLVRGEQVQLQAVAISLKPEAAVERLKVGGDVRTTGDQSVSLELLGTVGRLEVDGEVVAEGRDSDAVHVRVGSVDSLDRLTLVAAHGQRVVEVA